MGGSEIRNGESVIYVAVGVGSTARFEKKPGKMGAGPGIRSVRVWQVASKR